MTANNLDLIMELAEFSSRFFDGYSMQWFLYYFCSTRIDLKHTIIKRDEEGKIIGICVVTNERIYQSFPEYKENNKVISNYKCVSVLCVSPKYQKQGIATEMIEQVIASMKEDGIVFLYIQVLKSLSTHDFWRHRGAVPFIENSGVIAYKLTI